MRPSPPTLAQHIAKVAASLPTEHLRTQLGIYVEGLLSDLPRKSVEPIAARNATDLGELERRHTALLYFLRDAPWADEPVRAAVASGWLSALAATGTTPRLHLDEIVLTKKGDASVGVAAQMVDGSVRNCQLIPTLAMAARHSVLPVDALPYLPEGWLDDPARRKRARIPAAVMHRDRVDLACALVDRAKMRKVLCAPLVLSATFACSVRLRAHIRAAGGGYVCALPADTVVVKQRSFAPAMTVAALAEGLPAAAFEPSPHGTSGPLGTARYALVDVELADGGAQLLIERPADISEPGRTFAIAMTHRASDAIAVRAAIVPAFADAVSRLDRRVGLSSFEGRSLPALEHHLTAVMVAAAYLPLPSR